jgi:hypothetical protein
VAVKGKKNPPLMRWVTIERTSGGSSLEIRR